MDFILYRYYFVEPNIIGSPMKINKQERGFNRPMRVLNVGKYMYSYKRVHARYTYICACAEVKKEGCVSD